MKKVKKFLLSILCLVLVVVLSVAGTIAYLTDEEQDVNVMTMGNVDIEQLEYERVVDKEDNPVEGVLGEDFTEDYGITRSYKLQKFTQAKPAYPAVYANGTQAWDEFQQLWNQVGAPGSNDLFDDSMKNVVDKFVFVKNIGKSDAYYRTIIAIEAPEGVSDEMIHISFNSNSRFDYNTKEEGVQTAKEANSFFTTIDGVRYLVYTATYTDVLTPGEVSRPSLLQVFLDPSATNEDCEKFGSTWDIIVKTQAVQTKGFNNAQTALDTAFGEITPEVANAWLAGVKTPIIVETDEELQAALLTGRDIIGASSIDSIIAGTNVDGNGITITMNGQGEVDGAKKYGYLAFLPEAGENATVQNLTVTGSGFVEVGHYGIGGGTYTITKLNIKDMKSTVGVTNGNDNVSPVFSHYGTATLNDCVMTGAVSGVEGFTVYDAGFVNGTKTTINGGEYGSIYLWSQAHVTINNAKVGTIDSSAITTKNLGKLTIGAGTIVDVINLVPAGTYKPALVIEDGAKVGIINYKGNSYTQEQWKSVVL